MELKYVIIVEGAKTVHPNYIRIPFQSLQGGRRKGARYALLKWKVKERKKKDNHNFQRG